MERKSGRRMTACTASMVLIMIAIASIAVVNFTKGSDIQWKPSIEEEDLLLNVTNIPIHAGSNNGPRRTIIEEDGILYFLTSWTNGTIATLTLFISDDEGDTWNEPMDIWYEDLPVDVTSIPIMGIHIWQDKLFVFFRIAGDHRSEAVTYCKNARLDSLTDLIDQVPYEIIDYEANLFDMTSNDDHLFLAYSRQGENECYYTRYDGSNWSSPYKIAPRGEAVNVDIEIIDDDGIETLLYFYAQYNNHPYDKGKVYIRTSTDQGDSWSTARVVMDGNELYHIIDVEKVNGKLYLFAAEKTEDNIDLSISTNGGATWSTEKNLVTNRGINPVRFNGFTDTGLTDFSVGVSEDGMNFTLVYESGSQYIEMIESSDGGLTWTPEGNADIMSEIESFNPSVSQDGKYLTYYKLTDQWDVCYQHLKITKEINRTEKRIGPVILTEDVLKAKVNKTYSVVYNAYDPDTPQDELKWSMITNATWLTLSNGSKLSGFPTSAGRFWINISVSDGEYSDFSNFTITVHKGNTSTNQTEYPEYSAEPLQFSLPEDEKGHTVDLCNHFDLLQGFRLVELQSGRNFIVTQIDGMNFLVEPVLNWAGTSTIKILLQKDGVRIEREMEVTVLNRNDPPTSPVIEAPPMMIEGVSNVYTATAEDPDLPYGDILTFRWSVDGLGIKGEGEQIEMTLPSGIHILRVIVVDSEGEAEETSLQIEVNAEEDEESSSSFKLIIIILFIFIILIVSFILIISAFLRSKALRHRPDELERSPDGIGSVDGLMSDRWNKGKMNIPQDVTRGSIGRPGFSSNDHSIIDHVENEYQGIKNELLEGHGKWLDHDDLLISARSLRDQGKISEDTYELIKSRMRDD